ncbi:MAG: hypothetical protein Q9169_007593 [Polycauliona sp. 2 TL-2023]
MADHLVPDNDQHSVDSRSGNHASDNQGLTGSSLRVESQCDSRGEQGIDRQETSDDEPDTYNPIIEIPSAIRDLETSSMFLRGKRQAARPHERYTRFLHHLCQQTGTGDAEGDCLQYWPDASSEICTLDMSQSFADNKQLDLFAYAMLIYVWLVVCKKRRQGTRPDEDKYLHQQLAVYYLSAWDILYADGTDPGELSPAVKYWEDRAKRINFSSRSHWLQHVTQDDPDASCYRNKEAEGYLTTLSNSHIEGLTRELMRLEVKLQKSAMNELPDMENRKGLLIMMLSIEPELLTAIIEGQVARKAEIPNSSVCNCLLKMSQTNNLPPSIYQNSICDHEGFAPTPCQWAEIHDLMQTYISKTPEGDNLAAVVDQVIHPSKSFPAPETDGDQRFRRYIDFNPQNGERRLEPSNKRRANIHGFATELFPRLEGDAAEPLHVPMAAPVVEIGFSDNVLVRLRHHQEHQGSNYIMNLAQALFEYRYPTFFCLKQHVIYHCFTAEQPWTSEIILTRLAQGYIANGCGFSHYGAGFSNGSAWKTRTEGEWAAFLIRKNSDKGFRDRTAAVRQRAVERLKREETEAAERAWEIQYLQAMGDVMGAMTHFDKARREFMDRG